MAAAGASRTGGEARACIEPTMDTARWERLCALVEQAGAEQGAAREAVLSRAAAGDPALADEARRMLAADRADDDFLEPPASGGSVSAALDARAADGPASIVAPGTRIGRYRLLEPLASGGMGSVFLAEQDEPRRRVALKVLRAGVLSAGHRRRFALEAQLLARLAHPAIAQVHEAGLHEAGGLHLPWLALELVPDARPLTRWAHETGASRRARVELFRQVCDAVHHGHLRGIVHRDLKPGNVLVDGAGRPKVIDFGVARALDDDERTSSVATAPGQVLGTLPYMSPEQLAGGEVDARSDVHALGVLLYELLTGHLPYDVAGASLAETARVVQEQSPRRPSAHDPALRGDLETVLLAALDKDPARRYPSAAALADDLARWLESRPIAAQPASAWHQARLFARRHRALVGAAAAVLVVALAATALSASWAVRAGAAEERATALFETLLERSLTSTFDHAARANELLGGAPLARAMLDAALADLTALRAQAADDARVAAQLAGARLRLGDVLGNPAFPNLGDRAAATGQYRAALEAAEALADGAHGGEARRVAAVARRRLGHMAFYDGRLEESVGLLAASLDELAALAAAAPDDVVLRHELAAAHDALVAPLGRLARREQAAAHAAAAIDGYAALVGSGIDARGLAAKTAVVQINLGGLHQGAGRHADALTAFSAACDALASLSAAAPEDVSLREKLAWATTWVGTSLQTLGRREEARAALHDALLAYRELVAHDAGSAQHALRLANAACSLGQVERDLAGDDPEGLRASLVRYDEAVATLERAAGAGSTAGAGAGAGSTSSAGADGAAALLPRVRAERAALAERLARE